VRRRIVNDVAECLLKQAGIGAHQWQIGSQFRLKGLIRAATPCRADDALSDLAQINPVEPQLERTFLDSGDGEQVADHLVEALCLALDVAEQIVSGGGIELAAVLHEAGGRAENRGKRRAKIVGDRSEQGVAHPLGGSGGACRQDLAGKCGSVERRGSLVGKGTEQRARLGIARPEH